MGAILRIYLTFVVAQTAACTGAIGGIADGAPDSRSSAQGASGASHTIDAPIAACSKGQVAHLRRLDQSEYANTIRELFASSAANISASALVQDSYPADPLAYSGFTNDASVLRVTPEHLDTYFDAAKAISESVDKNGILPGNCLAPRAGADQTLCATTLIEDLGKRAFRRPLIDVEKANYLALYEASLMAQGSYESAIRFVVRGFLASPYFLHRAEIGAGTTLTPYETASLLSYFIWGSMPDAALFSEADAGRLATSEQISGQVRRMLTDSRAKMQVRSFFGQWFKLNDVLTTPKDVAVYKGFDDNVRQGLLEASLTFVQGLAFQGSGGLAALFADKVGYYNNNLAQFYGVSGDFSDTIRSVPLADTTARAGILGQEGFLSIYAYGNGSSPVHRGVFVLRKLLCQSIPPPPPNVPNAAIQPVANATTRQRFEQHTKSAFCASCHNLFDPFGNGFEHYDGIGRYRDTENGQPIDSSGVISGTRDIDGPFDGVVELGTKLSRSADVISCTSRYMYRFAAGRLDNDSDACSLDGITDKFANSGGDFAELMGAIAKTLATDSRTVE